MILHYKQGGNNIKQNNNNTNKIQTEQNRTNKEPENTLHPPHPIGT